jgi:ribonuclease D
VALCKKNQKADWSRRPLPRSMLLYAVEDTRYLEALARDLAAQLAEKGRAEWHRESCQRVLELSRASRSDDAEDPWRIRGANNLHSGALAILKVIWEWREKEAELADLPVFKILSNDQLLGLSLWADRYRHMPPPAWSDWPHRISERRMHALLAAVERGRAAPPEPRMSRGQRPTPDPLADRRMERLKAHRDQLAKDLALDPGLIASRLLLIALARQPAEAPAQLLAERRVCRWQIDLLRPALEAEG